MTGQPSSGRAKKLWPWWVSLVGILAVAAHGATWWVVTGRVRDGIEAFVADAARDGWTLQHGATERSGWPWAASVHLQAVSARRNLGGTAFEWKAEQVTVTVAATDPNAIRISPSGHQSAGLGPATAMPLQAAAWLRIPFDGGAPATFELRNLVAQGFRAGLVNGRATPSAFELTAAPVMLDQAPAAPFDQGFALTVAAALSRPLRDAATPRETAAAWQAGGGEVTVPRMELQWGPVHLTGNGSAGLDARLQPRGKAALHIEGGPEVLEAAARAGLVAPGPASAVRAVLGLLALASPGGVVAVPVTLEDGTLTAAQFPLLRLPQIDWSVPAARAAPRIQP